MINKLFKVVMILVISYAVIHLLGIFIMGNYIKNEPDWQKFETRGHQLYSSGRYEEALQMYLQAIELAQSSLKNDENKKIFLIQLHVSNAICYQSLENNEKTLEEYDAIIRIAKDIEGSDKQILNSKYYWLATTNINKGIFELETNNKESANLQFINAIKYAELIDETSIFSSKEIVRISEILLEYGNIGKSKTYEALRREMNDPGASRLCHN